MRTWWIYASDEKDVVALYVGKSRGVMGSERNSI